MAASGWLAAGSIGGKKEALRGVQPEKEKAQRASLALSMYTDLPDGEVAIEEFERFAMDRLRGGWAGWGLWLPFAVVVAP